MKIQGLHAEEAPARFAPTQFVNVWDVWTRGFYCEAQMSDLPDEVRADPEAYFLEPTTADGLPISLSEALKARKTYDENLKG